MTEHAAPPHPQDDAAAPVPARRRRGVAGRWAAALAACAAAFAAVYLVFVCTSTGQVLEYQVFHAVEHRYGLAATGLTARTLTVLPPALAALAALAGAVALARPRTRRRGVVALVALVGANATTQALKAVLPRPDLDNPVPWAGGNSLPSGHTTLAAAAVAAALLLVPARWRPATALVGAGTIAVTGAGAYFEAWHRPSDIAAACAVAAFWAGLVSPWRRAGHRAPRRASGLARSIEALLWSVGVAAGAAGLLLMAATLVAPTPSTEVHEFALPAGLLLSCSPALLLPAALLTGLRRAER